MLLEAMDQKLSQHQHYSSRKLSPLDKELRHGRDFRIRYNFISIFTCLNGRKFKFYFGENIRHYAGDVVYDIGGFLDKNKDTLFQDFKRLLYGSKDANIRHMWPEGAQDIHKV